MNDTRAPHDGSTGRPILFLLIRREILMRLRSRAFRIMTVLVVLLMAAGVLFVNATATKSVATRIAFIGQAQALSKPFAAAAASLVDEVTIVEVSDQSQGQAEVEAGKLDVLVTGTATRPTAIVTDQLDSTTRAILDGLAKQQAFDAQVTAAGLDATTVAAAIAGAGVETQSLSPAAPADPERTQKIVIAVLIAYVLTYALTFYGEFVASGVVEEKSTRIVEILLSTVRPSQLLVGKIVGIGLVGLFQLSIFAAAALVLAGLTNTISVPAVGAGAIAVDLAWFLLGFFLYAAAFAAGASLVSRREDLTNAIVLPIAFVVFALLLAIGAASEPSTTRSTILSLLPPFAPMLMTVRLATSDVPIWQVLLSVGLTIASALGLTWLAARMYSNSILHVGARLKLRDALRGR